MKYSEEYSIAKWSVFAFLPVSTRILLNTSRFHATAAFTVAYMFQESISLSLNLHAFPLETNDMPTLERTAVVLPAQVNTAPTRLPCGVVMFSEANVGHGKG